jgi:hypothetical protein
MGLVAPPPHTIILESVVHTAAGSSRAGGAPAVGNALQVSVAGS